MGALPPAPIESTELQTAIRVARRMLLAYGDITDFDVFAYAQAHGGLREALRILLRALGAEPGNERQAGPRCPAAHPEDPSPCRGPIVVTILDQANAGADGCEHHATRLLASLTDGRPVAKPDAPAGIALKVFRAAGHTRPFAWREAGQ
ncbi:hypothetical protein HKX69_29905 [Streptomyces argyrophyllae]|uniref:Uncharacterized protein n=1 Tax=Streptomyces argyrophylli TaxID=2726118 RepID=A0A6M4PVN8_9ACTN|nr:hypothetical protein HKX69_29905 [Streptomyces argyrophyllae]